MNKKMFFAIGLILFLVIVYFIYTKLFDRKFKFELTNNQSKVLLDSIKLNDELNLYWFKYESYTGNSSVSFLGINKSACDCDASNAIVKGEFIQGIKDIKNDSIYIVSRYGYDVIGAHKSPYEFVDVRSNENIDALKHIKTPIYIRELCK